MLCLCNFFSPHLDERTTLEQEKKNPEISPGMVTSTDFSSLVCRINCVPGGKRRSLKGSPECGGLGLMLVINLMRSNWSVLPNLVHFKKETEVNSLLLFGFSAQHHCIYSLFHMKSAQG